jgi:hypothetical protein
MAAGIDQIDVIVAVHVHSVGAVEIPLSPGIEKLTVAVEYHDGHVPAIENIHVVVRIDAHGGGIATETDALRQCAPTWNGFEVH